MRAVQAVCNHPSSDHACLRAFLIPAETEHAAGSLSKLDQYEQLMKALAASSSSEVDEIVRRFRSNPDPAPILQAIRAKLLLTPLRNVEETLGMEAEFSGRDREFRLVEDAASNSQLHQPSAMDSEQSDVSRPYANQTWTTVTHDEDFIHHLFRIYFAWQHTFFQNFPEELFRADYNSGRTRYCSKLLVNSICAAGCLLCRRTEPHQDPDEFTTAGDQFYAEAMEKLNETAGPSICTVAALCVLAHFEGARGHLRTMWDYSGRSGRMALDMSLNLMDRNGSSDSEEGEVDEEAHRHTFWGCFITDQ